MESLSSILIDQQDKSDIDKHNTLLKALSVCVKTESHRKIDCVSGEKNPPNMFSGQRP